MLSDEVEKVSPYSPDVDKVLDRYVGKFKTKEEWVEALGQRIVELEAALIGKIDV